MQFSRVLIYADLVTLDLHKLMLSNGNVKWDRWRQIKANKNPITITMLNSKTYTAKCKSKKIWSSRARLLNPRQWWHCQKWRWAKNLPHLGDWKWLVKVKDPLVSRMPKIMLMNLEPASTNSRTSRNNRWSKRKQPKRRPVSWTTFSEDFLNLKNKIPTKWINRWDASQIRRMVAIKRKNKLKWWFKCKLCKPKRRL